MGVLRSPPYFQLTGGTVPAQSFQACLPRIPRVVLMRQGLLGMGVSGALTAAGGGPDFSAQGRAGTSVVETESSPMQALTG